MHKKRYWKVTYTVQFITASDEVPDCDYQDLTDLDNDRDFGHIVCQYYQDSANEILGAENLRTEIEGLGGDPDVFLEDE